MLFYNCGHCHNLLFDCAYSHRLAISLAAYWASDFGRALSFFSFSIQQPLFGLINHNFCWYLMCVFVHVWSTWCRLFWFSFRLQSFSYWINVSWFIEQNLVLKLKIICRSLHVKCIRVCLSVSEWRFWKSKWANRKNIQFLFFEFLVLNLPNSKMTTSSCAYSWISTSQARILSKLVLFVTSYNRSKAVK